jgi:hypothetical protein
LSIVEFPTMLCKIIIHEIGIKSSCPEDLTVTNSLTGFLSKMIARQIRR